MASSGKICSTSLNLLRSLTFPHIRSRTQAFLAPLLTLVIIILIIVFFPCPNSLSPINNSTFTSRLPHPSNYISSLSSITTPPTSRKENCIICIQLENEKNNSRNEPSVPVEKKKHGSRNEHFIPVKRREQISRNETFIPVGKRENGGIKDFVSCDIFDGRWVDDDSAPLYDHGSCPFVDDGFNCVKNGRPDSVFNRLKWKPFNCELPRFDGLEMLKVLKGKRMVFVGDSLNRNMWESLVCALRASLTDKSRVAEVSGRREFRTQGFYSFKFKDFGCSIDFIKSPFLVQEWRFSDKAGARRETLRLDMIHRTSVKYYDADIIIFNTGHWWTHLKTYKGSNYFQEGNHVYNKLEVPDAYTKALRTWGHWVDSNVNSSRTMVFFRGYSSSHFKGGQWNSGGSCDGETRPIINDTYLNPYPWMMRVLESVIAEMKSPVSYLNITRMTDYRKDGHPSIFRQPKQQQRRPGRFQDCSHWCLPGVPDAWNELLYAILVHSYK